MKSNRFVRLISIYIFICIFHSAHAQYWKPLGGGLKSDFPNGEAIVGELVVDTFHNYLWVQGGFDTAGGNVVAHDLAIWTGTQWKAVEHDVQGVSAVTMKKDTLIYALGDLTNHEVGMLVDTVFVGTVGTQADVNVLYVYHDTILAGGDMSGGIKYWNGSQWNIFEGGIGGPNFQVHAFGEYNGELIVGGHFSTAGGVSVNNIAAWDGSEWHALGDGITSSNFANVYAVQEFNGELYVGGYFDEAGGIYTGDLATWNGSDWNLVLLSSFGTTCGRVYDLFAGEDALYLAGATSGYSGCMGSGAAFFNEAGWNNLHLAESGIPRAIAIFDNVPIAGTDFKVGLTDTINYIGRFIGYPTNNVSTPGAEEVSTIVPNPTLSTFQIHLSAGHLNSLFIFNLLGEKVKEQTITGSDITLDVSELPAGMYVVRGGEWSGKFVKE